MATESVATEASETLYLPIPAVDRGEDILYKVSGILECVQAASEHAAELPNCAIHNACWAAAGLLTELREIVNLERPAGERVGVGAQA